jgi:hypothetical protein
VASAPRTISTHLESRHEVGLIPRESGVPTIGFRSSIIIGSGSVVFEIVRSLVERSPVLVIPRWAVSRTQPIAVENVLAYLLGRSRPRRPTASRTPTSCGSMRGKLVCGAPPRAPERGQDDETGDVEIGPAQLAVEDVEVSRVTLL